MEAVVSMKQNTGHLGQTFKHKHLELLICPLQQVVNRFTDPKFQTP